MVISFCGIPVFAQSKAVICVSAETAIENDRVTLGDIAEISGAGEEAKNRLKMVSLGYAPNVGMTREIFKDKILLAIAAAGFSKNDFSLDAPPKIFVRRTAQTVGRNLLREAVEKAVLTNFQNENITAKIVRLDLPSDMQIPSGKVEVRANPINAGNFFLPFSVSLEIRVDEKIVRRVSATVQIEASAEILVAAKDLISGAKITETDVKKEIRRLEKPLNSYLRDTAKLRGTVLIKNLSGGAEITTDAVVAGYVIRGGDLVRIVGESGKMQIIINGEARASGKIGDRIAVKNSQSGTILQAVVVDEGLVKVLF
ncbi:MAG: flagellar basal body P-ring formation chaperone FlgA [Pyrinomonadaceae bacterium]